MEFGKSAAKWMPTWKRRSAARSPIVDPADGKIPYKPEALAKKKELSAQRATADPATKCWMQGVPRMVYSPYPFRIAQAADQPVIAFLSQYVHTVRNINMGGEHLDGLDLWLGDSRGHWEGDTLVVDVADFNDMTWLDAAGSLSQWHAPRGGAFHPHGS